MKISHLLYHENNLKKPYIPQEDQSSFHENIFVVADGITHDLMNGVYPVPSDSAEVSRIICKTITSELKSTSREIEDLKKSINAANKVVENFNSTREIYKYREENGFTIGAAVFAAIIIKENRLIYAVLDDCYFSIFSNDLVDHPTLKSFVDISAKYYDSNYDWNSPSDRKVWRKDIRNHLTEVNGNKIGYGAIDGREGYEQFLQFGEVELRNNDLICLYTDGFIKIMRDLNFIKNIKDNKFTMETYNYISDYTKQNNIVKEKTSYFIKVSD